MTTPDQTTPPAAPHDNSDLVQTFIRAAFTLVVLAAAGWWLYEVSSRLGTAPTKDAQGTVVVDEYQRAKDILLVVLPIVTSVLGYWFGSQGKEKADAAATKANDEASKAKDEAHDAKQQLAAITAAAGDPELLTKARSLYPHLFRR